MTDSEIRILIAEACGWVSVRTCLLFDESEQRHYDGLVGYGPDNPFPHDKGEKELPDYPNDLNAMHEAEKTLSNDDWDDKFYHWIGFVVSGGQTSQLWEYRKQIVHATSRQRSEAFLRTIGKWS